jgi:Bacterial protein of unknown function (DUF885)
VTGPSAGTGEGVLDPRATRAPAFAAWLDGFLVSYFRHRPVNATCVGVHAHDGRLPDLSEAGLDAAGADAESLLADLRALPDEPLDEAGTLDRTLAQGFLEIQRWELGSDHFARGNPSLQTGEAAFGLVSLLRRPFAPLAQRLGATLQRVEAIPALLDSARAVIGRAPSAWIERAEHECAGLRALLGDGLERILATAEIDGAALRAAARRARGAVEGLAGRLREARGDAHHHYACGAEALDLLLRRGHFLSEGAEEIERYAWDRLGESEARLREQAHDLGAASWAEALAGLADVHPSADAYHARFGELWAACRERALAHRLVTWPDLPVRYVARPAWVEAAAPHLYFLAYHAPAPGDDLPETEYLVTPIEPDMPPAEQARRLRLTNDSVIKLNHVAHHGALGHHVQNWHAARARSRIGQIAAVDCASRIALFCGITMAEGWACYATELLGEVGFFTPGEALALRHGQLRMAARAVVDVRLHQGRFTLDEAAAFYRDRVGLAPAAARAEAVKNSLFPGTALAYLMGTDAIHRLRQQLSPRRGFELGSFHDALLASGSVPVALVAEAMRSRWWPATSGPGSRR